MRLRVFTRLDWTVRLHCCMIRSRVLARGSGPVPNKQAFYSENFNRKKQGLYTYLIQFCLAHTSDDVTLQRYKSKYEWPCTWKILRKHGSTLPSFLNADCVCVSSISTFPFLTRCVYEYYCVMCRYISLIYLYIELQMNNTRCYVIMCYIRS